MKKRVVLYTIYCCAVVFVLATFLVYKVNARTDDTPATRATSIMLNTPREITITTNKRIKLLDGFLSVEPANAVDLLTYSISASATTSVDYIDFDFEDKSFVARKTGYYYIKFEIPKNGYSNLNDTLKIHAIADTKQDFSLKTNQIFVGNTVKFEDIFEKNSVFNYVVELQNNNLSFSDGCFTAIKSGITQVSITITKNFVSYTNIYSIHVENDFIGPQDPEDNDQDDDQDKNDEQGGKIEDNNDPNTNNDENDNGNLGDGGGEYAGDSGEDENTDNPGKDENTDNPGKDEDTDDPGKDENTDNPGKDENEEKGDGSDEQGGAGGNVDDENQQKPQEKYKINVKREKYNQSTHMYTVQFEVLLGDNQLTSQKIMATVSDPSIAKVMSTSAPLVSLQILKSGSFTLTLTLIDNPEISISIEIAV